MVELLLAWRNWDHWATATRRDRLKGGERQTARMETVCAVEAARLGMTTTVFRDALMAARRTGLEYEDSIVEVCG